VFDDQIVIRVKSMNAFGWSIVSQLSLGQARILTEPIQMSMPTYIALESNGEQMSLRLTSLVSLGETGGSIVDSYKVEYSIEAADSWTTAKDDLEVSLLIEGLTLGLVYEIRCSAQNIHGWSQPSDSLVVQSSSVPS